MKAYYNEFDHKAAAWLRELGRDGNITAGLVDETSIKDLMEVPNGFQRYHFFAGIGGWDYALKLAGWPEEWPVWTGSCPCQPFSAAGKGKGIEDSRHLWPDFARLIRRHKPPIVFGEQVASNLGRDWLCGIRADLEGMGYEVGAADLCAAGVNAPHIRQRLFWVGVANGTRWEPWRIASAPSRQGNSVESTSSYGGMAFPISIGRGGGCERPDDTKISGCGLPEIQAKGSSPSCRLGHADNAGPQGRGKMRQGGNELSAWSSSVAIPCSDGKARRIESGICPLADGVSGRVGLLRGYGNAIVPQVAAVFIKAVMEYLSNPKEVKP